MAATEIIENGGEVAAIVLLGPTWDATNENGVPTQFDDPNGGWAAYMDALLLSGVRILVVDDGMYFDKDQDASKYSAPDGAIGTYTYLRILIKHYDGGGVIWEGTNISKYVKNIVYSWLSAR
jgi:hypothetical protein